MKGLGFNLERIRGVVEKLQPIADGPAGTY